MSDSNMQLLISLISIVAVIFLFLHYSKNFKKEKNPGVNILYISGYAVMLIIGLVVAICIGSYQKDDIMSYISFGSNLSSLIMSVIAIIFTITQTDRGKQQLGKIEQASDQLIKAAEDLTEYKAIAQVLNDNMAMLYDKMEEVGNKTDDVKNSVAKLGNKYEKNNSERSEEHEKNFDLKDYLLYGSITGALSLLACSYAYEDKTELKLKDLATAIGSTDESYIYGYLISSSSIGVVGLENKNHILKIESVYDNLKDDSESFIKRVYNENNTVKGSAVIKMFNNIRRLFNLPEITEDELKNKQ